MSETIRSRLHRTSLADLLSITRDLGELSLGYELRTSFERLDAGSAPNGNLG